MAGAKSDIATRTDERPRTAPRLSIGLPVYNGARFLAAALDALLGQTFEDFELIISDNASTDGTAEIGRRYAAEDARVRYIRQWRNIGAAPNHNFVARVARGALFKWASYDDLYARDLLESCVAILDEHPHVVLAHSWTATIDADDTIVQAVPYPLATAAPAAPDRFRSLLFDEGGDDFYGIVRSDVLRRVLPHGSFHHADRTLVTALSLYGPFQQVPDWRYFRRVHPQQADQAYTTARARCANLDPRRVDRLRHPAARLYGEYVWDYVAAVGRAPLTREDRLRCFGHLTGWASSRARRLRGYRGAPPVPGSSEPALVGRTVDAFVARRARPAT